MQRKAKTIKKKPTVLRLINERDDGIWQLRGRVQRGKLRSRRARRSSPGKAGEGIKGSIYDFFLRECKKMMILFGLLSIEGLITFKK
jgi:hypothetical protein